MAQHQKDGGPAFPAGFESENHFQEGMSLRDWFAGLAMQGMNANPDLLEVVTSGSVLDGSTFERMAKRAYQQADAMLAEVRGQPAFTASPVLELAENTIENLMREVEGMRDAITHPNGRRAHFVDSQDQVRVDALTQVLDAAAAARDALTRAEGR